MTTEISVMYGSEKVKAFITNMTVIFHWTPNYLPPVPKINLYIFSILVSQFPLFSSTFSLYQVYLIIFYLVAVLGMVIYHDGF